MKPKALIITGYGINCEEETAQVFDSQGAEAKIMHLGDIIKNPACLNDFQILAFPGGFSYGDDTGSGNAIANKIKNNINDELLRFAQEDKLIIGICNGFQMLANLGLVPAINNAYGERRVALMHNAQARYECRWIHVKTSSDKCIWTRNIDSLHIPIAHGEGNFYTDEETLKQIEANDQIAFRYTKEDGSPANGEFPHNPNGSLQDVAAICDPSGRILGMMPHPERFHCATNECGWTLKRQKLLREGKDLQQEGDGLKLFKNAVTYFTS
ncbi:phosphoribosylformylglycinamidine synthase I [Patescibacteria group bacterium]|nr:phosphoribosylformylglycinamidine synthase I [Patescibacteria group bacterium]